MNDYEFVMLTDENRQKLKKVSTATISTVLFKRGLRNAFMVGPKPMNYTSISMVGEAYTLRYIPAREDLDILSVFEDTTHPQRKGVEECPVGHVMVIDSRGDASAASAGNILVTRLMVRGAAGIVTDGGFRDSSDIAKLKFHVYQSSPSAPTNLTKHHAVDLDVPIGCGGVAVYPGDIVVGDGDGVIVVPQEICNDVATEAYDMTIFENFVEDRVKNNHTIFGLYPPTDPNTKLEFDKWLKARGM